VSPKSPLQQFRFKLICLCASYAVHNVFIPLTSNPTEEFFGEPLTPAPSPVDEPIAPTTEDPAGTVIPTEEIIPMTPSPSPAEEAPTSEDPVETEIPTENISPILSPVSSPVAPVLSPSAAPTFEGTG
jgi:hypothetical protein